jgi:hypothetical protein
LHAVFLIPHARKSAISLSEYLRELEAEFQQASARESGAQGGIVSWKKPKTIP